MFLFKDGRVRSSNYRFVLLVLISLLGSGVKGQEKESYMLDSVNVTWEAARGFFKELGDVRSLLNNYTVLEIARDPILVDYMEGFKARNNIDMMTVSYIYGEQLWEKVFGDPKKKQFEQASGDLVKSRIVFERKAPKTSEGYYVYLEVKGGSTKVYEMFDLTEAEFDSVVNEHAAILGTNNTIYTDPGDAHESVIHALIGALSEIEGGEMSEIDLQQKTDSVASTKSDSITTSDTNISEIDTMDSSEDDSMLVETYDTIQHELDSTLVVVDGLEYSYFVSDDDAWRRQGEAPYKTITPEPRTNILMKGTQVAVLEIVKDETGIDVAKIQMKSNGDIEYTTLSNLTPIREFSNERKYKFIKDYTALKIPFSEDDTDKTYKKNGEITVDKYCGGYVKVIGKDDAVEGYWIAKSALIWTDIVNEEDFLKETENATKVGTQYVGNETSVACNICVRAALVLLKEDPSLFPLTGSGYHDPYNGYKSKEIYGFITHPGQAKEIKEDFDVISTKSNLSARFTEIAKKTDEDWETYFTRLQSKADAGAIVIGAMLSSSGASGHVMMITPGGLVNIDDKTNKWGDSYVRKDRNILKVPRVLECGTGARNNGAPLCRNVDYIGATKRLIWYEY